MAKSDHDAEEDAPETDLEEADADEGFEDVEDLTVAVDVFDDILRTFVSQPQEDTQSALTQLDALSSQPSPGHQSCSDTETVRAIYNPNIYQHYLHF